MNQLENKVTLITGAKGGLGTSVTQAFLSSGATVVGSSRSIQISDFAHPNFTAIPAELSSVEAARSLADSVLVLHGRIDILVHVVGGFEGCPAANRGQSVRIQVHQFPRAPGRSTGVLAIRPGVGDTGEGLAQGLLN